MKRMYEQRQSIVYNMHGNDMHDKLSKRVVNNVERSVMTFVASQIRWMMNDKVSDGVRLNIRAQLRNETYAKNV